MRPEKIYEQKPFAINDIALAAAVVCFHPLVGVEKSPLNPQKAVFLFEDSEQVRELADKFWRKDLFVEASEYFSNIKFLKGRINAEQV